MILPLYLSLATFSRVLGATLIPGEAWYILVDEPWKEACRLLPGKTLQVMGGIRYGLTYMFDTSLR